MNAGRILNILAATAATAVVGLSAQAEEVRIYNWADYFAEDTLERFEAETGIVPSYDTYDSDELLMTRMLTGNSGYDVVFPGTAFAADMLEANVFQRLDPEIVTTRALVDREVMRLIMPSDADLDYFVPYTTAVTGFTYDANKVAERLGDVSLTSWEQIFDPGTAQALADCGIAMIDAPIDFFQVGLRLEGRDVFSTDRADLDAAARRLGALTPHVRYFESGRVISDLANGEICLALTWTGDGHIAAAVASETDNPPELRVVVPEEGTVFQANVMAIPADAPNPENANRLIEFLNSPEVHRDILEWVLYGTANTEALALLSKEARSAAGVTLSEEQLETMWPARNPDPRTLRTLNRMWAELKSGT